MKCVGLRIPNFISVKDRTVGMRKEMGKEGMGGRSKELSVVLRRIH